MGGGAIRRRQKAIAWSCRRRCGGGRSGGALWVVVEVGAELVFIGWLHSGGERERDAEREREAVCVWNVERENLFLIFFAKEMDFFSLIK